MLTIEFISFNQIENLSSDMRLKKILDIVKKDKIALLEGRLKKQEEVELIKRTMEEIDTDFTGIELSVLNPERQNETQLSKLKNNWALHKNRVRRSIYQKLNGVFLEIF